MYSAFYNSEESSEGVNVIKEKLKELVMDGTIVETEKITGTVVKKLACKVNPAKSDVSGTYTSDVILYAPDSLFDALERIFRSFLVHGTLSRHLLACAFLQQLKSS